MIFAVANIKGGSGKSITTLNLGASLMRRGHSVLVVDTDPQQGNVSQTVGVDKGLCSMYEVLSGERRLEEIIQNKEMFDIAPATTDMSGIETKLNSNGGIGRESKLREALSRLTKKYDVVLIDTPPTLSLLTTNALVAADKVIVVTDSDVNAMHGINQLNEMVKSVQAYYNPELSYAGILCVKHSARTKIAQTMFEVSDSLGKTIGAKAFESRIRFSVAVPESVAAGMSLYDYRPSAGVSADYEHFADEIEKILQEENK